MHTASYEFLMKPKESDGCHQTFSVWVGYGDETSHTRLMLTCTCTVSRHCWGMHIMKTTDISIYMLYADETSCY